MTVTSSARVLNPIMALTDYLLASSQSAAAVFLLTMAGVYATKSGRMSKESRKSISKVKLTMHSRHPLCRHGQPFKMLRFAADLLPHDAAMPTPRQGATERPHALHNFHVLDPSLLMLSLCRAWVQRRAMWRQDP